MRRILNLRHICIVACAFALGCADGAPDTQTANGGETDALISPTPDVGQIAADAGVEPDASASLDGAILPADMMAPEPEDTWADDVDEMVDRLGRLPEPGTEPGTMTIGAASAPERDGNFLCVEQEISETAQYAEYVATQANSNALWDGAHIQCQALSNGMFTEVALPRAAHFRGRGEPHRTGRLSSRHRVLVSRCCACHFEQWPAGQSSSPGQLLHRDHPFRGTHGALYGRGCECR